MKLKIRFLMPMLTLAAQGLWADPVTVRHTEGLIHGFVVLRSVDGEVLATGNMLQVANGAKVTSELAFKFKDGSVYEETSVFSQSKVFRLLTYHLVQKGPTFKHPTDMTINTSTGQVVVKYTDDGKEKTVNEHMKLPPDLANGIITTLLNDIDPKAAKTTVSMVASTPKPRLVKLAISPDGEDSFSVSNASFKAIRYLMKIEIGGISGVVAPIVGKQPPDSHFWILGGKAPVFLKSEGPLVDEGPIWRIELASPVWPKSESAPKRK